MLWAKGICTLLSPPRPSQQFQHLSVRLITRETEKLVLDQKFKPKSESLIPSFLFLTQRRDEAGGKAVLVLQTLHLCLIWCQSPQQCSQRPRAEVSTAWKAICRESWWLPRSCLLAELHLAQPQILQPHGYLLRYRRGESRLQPRK